jgi:branched-chain amino acid transport system substrate-binding protein
VIATTGAASRQMAEGIVQATKAAGIRLLDSFQLPENLSDASGVLSSVRTRKPDVLVCATPEQHSLLLARQMAATKTNVAVLYLEHGPQVPGFREALGPAAIGIAFPQYWSPRATFTDPVFGYTARFVDYALKKNPRPIGDHCAVGAACVVTFVAAMQASGGIEPKAVRDAIAATNIETVHGHVRFTADGDGDPAITGCGIGQIQKGGAAFVYPKSGRTADLIYPKPHWTDKT